MWSKVRQTCSLMLFFWLAVLVANAHGKPQPEDERIEKDASTLQISRPQRGVKLIGVADPWQELRIGTQGAVSPDGKFLAAIQDSRTLVFIELSTKQIVQQFPLELERITLLEFSPSGKWFCVGGYSMTNAPDAAEDSFSGVSAQNACYIFDRDFNIFGEVEIPATELDEPSLSLDMIHGASFSPDEEMLVVTGQLSGHWIDVKDCEVIQSKNEVDDRQVILISNTEAFLPRRKLLWNRVENTTIKCLKLGELELDYANFSYNFHPALPLVSYFDQKQEQFLVKNWRTGETLFQEDDKSGRLILPSFSPDGTVMSATVRTNKAGKQKSEFKMYDLEAAKILVETELETVDYLRVSFAGNDTIIVRSDSVFATVEINRDLPHAIQSLVHRPPSTRNLCVDARGSWAVINNGKNWIDLNDGRTRSLQKYYSVPLAVNRSADSCIAAFGQELRLLNVPKSKQLRSYKLPEPPAVINRVVEFIGGKNKSSMQATQSIAVQLLDRQACAIVCLSNDFDYWCEYVEWNLKSGKQARSFRIQDQVEFKPSVPGMFLATISPDAKRIAYQTRSHLKIVDTETQETVATVKADSEATSLQFSNDGRFIAVGSGSHLPNYFQNVTVFEIDTENQVKKLDLELAQFSFAADAPVFAIASRVKGSPVKIFDTEDWEVEKEFSTDYGQRSSMQFSADGKTLAFGLTNSQIEVWNLDSIDGQR